MPPVMFSVVTKYHKGRHSLFLYNSEIFYAFTQDILRSQIVPNNKVLVWGIDLINNPITNTIVE
ncbi:hypothetical protein CXB68_00070 [Latilactobacillus sakei]|nr:hypothetical protein CXB68_00070 [Latilactobacillus sakei]